MEEEEFVLPSAMEEVEEEFVLPTSVVEKPLSIVAPPLLPSVIKKGKEEQPLKTWFKEQTEQEVEDTYVDLNKKFNYETERDNVENLLDIEDPKNITDEELNNAYVESNRLNGVMIKTLNYLDKEQKIAEKAKSLIHISAYNRILDKDVLPTFNKLEKIRLEIETEYINRSAIIPYKKPPISKLGKRERELETQLGETGFEIIEPQISTPKRLRKEIKRTLKRRQMESVEPSKQLALIPKKQTFLSRMEEEQKLIEGEEEQELEPSAKFQREIPEEEQEEIQQELEKVEIQKEVAKKSEIDFSGEVAKIYKNFDDEFQYHDMIRAFEIGYTYNPNTISLSVLRKEVDELEEMDSRMQHIWGILKENLDLVDVALKKKKGKVSKEDLTKIKLAIEYVLAEVERNQRIIEKAFKDWEEACIQRECRKEKYVKSERVEEIEE